MQAGDLLLSVEAQCLLPYAEQQHLWVYVDFIDLICHMTSQVPQDYHWLWDLTLPTYIICHIGLSALQIACSVQAIAKVTFRNCTVEGSI